MLLYSLCDSVIKMWISLLIMCSTVPITFTQMGVGDYCYDEITFSLASCEKLENCLHLKPIINAGRNYTRCGSSNSSEVVCCPAMEDLPDLATITTTKTTIPPSSTPRISQLKCSEYAESVFVTGSIFKGLQKKYFKIDLCSHKVIPLIVGGENAREKEFPHMALLGYGDGEHKIWKCAGTLISDEYVLTAAHCMVSQYGELRKVRLGEYNKEVSSFHREEFGVSKTILHPNYDVTSPYYDVALVQLDRKVMFDAYKRPACLSTEFERNETYVVATGWGLTSFSGLSPNILQKVVLNLFRDEECRTAFPSGPDLPNGFNPSLQLCAGSYTHSKDTCQGDSGGPLQIYHQTEHCMYTVVGVTSFGGLCGEIGTPGGYERVYSYLDWIESIVWPS